MLTILSNGSPSVVHCVTILNVNFYFLGVLCTALEFGCILATIDLVTGTHSDTLHTCAVLLRLCATLNEFVTTSNRAVHWSWGIY